MCGYHLMDSSESSGDKPRGRSPSEEKHQTNKLFITNIDGKGDLQDIENELRRNFQKYGVIDNLVAKRNRNSEYCFAFVDMKDHAAAIECVKAYDQSYLTGKQIKVEFQDDQKRRKDSNKGCYNCGKMGHFARECHSARDYGGDRDRGGSGRGGYRRSRSPSEDSYRRRHKKHKRRRSDSSERGRSRTPKHKKDRKHRSRDRDEKRKKKHRRSYSSGSSR